MNVAYARKLLSVTEKDDLQSLKKKYRRLMSECHPDALGSDNPKHIRRAQEINEAYQLLKKEPHAFRTKMSGREDRRYGREGKKYEREEKKRPEWTGQVNERAFRDRKIYQYYSMEPERRGFCAFFNQYSSVGKRPFRRKRSRYADKKPAFSFSGGTVYRACKYFTQDCRTGKKGQREPGNLSFSGVS